nr:ABC transporter ATP-binding protein [uncultured Devosia sp.]
MTAISLRAIGKTFGDSAAVSSVSLDLPAGSFTALLGPSGCGKTTLLRLIAGFEQPTSGAVAFDGVVMGDASRLVPPEKRQLGIVFQSYALWPHMDVAANVAYPLKGKGLNRAEIESRVAAALAMVSLTGFGARSVDALSGGQRQRVALARCLVTGTKIILLDEPLANLDVHLRASMLDVFADIHQRTGATIVFVTHDQSEALALADRVVVLDAGAVQQVGTPQQIYAEPANGMVAGFVGRGAMLSATVTQGLALVDGVALPVRGACNGPCRVLIRPQAIRLADTGLAATVTRRRYAGAYYETTLTLNSGEQLHADLNQPLDPGTTVHFAITDAWAISG